MKSISKKDLIRHSEVLWEIPRSFRRSMQVPALIFAEEEILEAMLLDRSLQQLVNVSTLSGIEHAVMVMPDAHEGYGFPIGGVAATRYPDGAISPGGIGYDINCGVRLLGSQVTYRDIKTEISSLSEALYRKIPSGPGQGGDIQLGARSIDRVLRQGAGWAVKKGYGTPEDLEYTESNGCLPGADPDCVSPEAKKRGLGQLGTIGAGNHFVEVDRVEEIYDPGVADAFRLFQDQIVILIHTGSRGLGHQVATDYLRLMVRVMVQYGIKPADRELASVPFSSREGQEYFKAMLGAANYAWCNRQIITWEVRQAWESLFGTEPGQIFLIYDIAHNMAKIETHTINGVNKKLIIHRKGATRAFGPGHRDLPEAYRETGQPVLIPGSMGTASWVMAGTPMSSAVSFASACHGAGRRLSRSESKRQVDAPGLKRKLEAQGIYIQAGSFKGIAEEAPIAYKDVDQVVETVQKANIAKKVARLRPLAVVKG